MRLSPSIRHDTAKVLQSLSMVDSSGGHFPLVGETGTLGSGCLAVRPTSSLTDYKSPRLTVRVSGTLLQGAIVDGGSGINLMPEYTMIALGLQTTRPANFSVTLADQRSVPPIGIVENVGLEIQGVTFR